MLDDLEGWMKERGAKSIQVHSEDFFRGNVYHNMTGIVFSRGIVMHRIFCRSCTELRPDDNNSWPYHVQLVQRPEMKTAAR